MPMKKQGYYSSGQFAKLAGVSVRTIRFYDTQNILKPSLVTESGARFYTDSDLVRLQEILLFKYLGFSLDDIRLMTISDGDEDFMLSSLSLQKKLVEDRIEQLHLVSKAIDGTVDALKKDHAVDWIKMLNLIHLTGMEKSLAGQYKDAANLSARINLHTMFSQNPQHWFPWLYDQLSLQDNQKILEVGCGSGSLWSENMGKIPPNVSLVLSDISDGMIRDARNAIGITDRRFSFRSFDCSKIPLTDTFFDRVIANHVLFYCKNIPRVCAEIKRVMKEDGQFICSTYSAAHMAEITQLVQEFDSRIVLSADHLYERFGLENGENILHGSFSKIELRRYKDELIVNKAQPLIEYILSCHGNQNQYILDRYKEFHVFVEDKTSHGFHITKDAGVFICRK